MLAATREHLRPDLPPEHLRERVVARAELRRAAGPGVGFVEPVERVERLRERRRRARQEALVAQFLEETAPFCSELGGGGGIVGQELDDGRLYSRKHRELDSPATLG